MQEETKAEELTEGLKKYINTNIELIKLEVTERSSTIGSGLIGILLVIIAAAFFIFFISFWLGFYLSAKLDSQFSGFAIIGGFYFVLAVSLFLLRKKLVEKPLRDQIIMKVFSKN